jgi:hypothetical protein
MNRNKILDVPESFYLKDTFIVPEDELRSFFGSFVGFIDESNNVYIEEVDVEQTVRSHTGDCRIWYKEGGYEVLSGYTLIMNCNYMYEDIFEWMEDYMPRTYKNFMNSIK